jgi:hypothetical protein
VTSSGRFATGSVSCADQNREPACGQRAGDGETDTLVGAGDQRDLVFVHGSDIASGKGAALAILGVKFDK